MNALTEAKGDDPPGAWTYHLRIPPLDLPRYGRASALLIRPFLRSGDRLRPFVALAMGALVGAAGAYALIQADAGAELVAYATRPEFAFVLSGIEFVLAIAGVILLTIAALSLLIMSRQRRFLRAAHAASRMLNAHNDLLLGETGLEWRAPDSTLRVRWQGVADSIRHEGTLYLRLDGLTFVWLPNQALGDAARREEILAFIADRIARSRAPAPAVS